MKNENGFCLGGMFLKEGDLLSCQLPWFPWARDSSVISMIKNTEGAWCTLQGVWAGLWVSLPTLGAWAADGCFYFCWYLSHCLSSLFLAFWGLSLYFLVQEWFLPWPVWLVITVGDSSTEGLFLDTVFREFLWRWSWLYFTKVVPDEQMDSRRLSGPTGRSKHWSRVLNHDWRADKRVFFVFFFLFLQARVVMTVWFLCVCVVSFLFCFWFLRKRFKHEGNPFRR